MSTDYTPAMHRFNVALANDMHLHANAEYVVEAARAVLEEEKANEEEAQAILARQSPPHTRST